MQKASCKPGFRPIHVKEKDTVLVIDDYAPARDAVKFALKEHFNCLSASSAKQGLEILRTNPVDVVILDIRMPEMDGIEALHRIKEMGINTQVILLTGHGSLDTARKAIRYGAFDYLTKPFDIVNLRKVITEAVQNKHLIEKEGKDDELEKLAQSLTAKLGEASRLARTSELSSEALMEMKSPLTAIVGYTQMLLDKLRDRRIKLLGTKSLRYLSIIEEEATKCVEIASRLMSLAKQNPGRNGAIGNEVVRNVAALMRPQCSMSRIDLLIAPSPQDVVVDVPTDDLHVVLVNLVLNSIEAIEGPGEIRIKSYDMLRDNPLLVSTSPSEKEFLQHAPQPELFAIEVSDTGRGIESQHIASVFEPFFTTKADSSGAGLGLSICKDKVERCGGHIGVLRSSPRGTTVRMLLPVSSHV